VEDGLNGKVFNRGMKKRPHGTSFYLHGSVGSGWTGVEVEARDGIEPPNKALQTLPFSFWVPRPLHGEGDTAMLLASGIRAAILLVPSLMKKLVENCGL
jgi:hypothetical protein